MTNIKRYRLYNYSDCIWEDDDGEVVWYDDHLAIVERMRERIEELEGDIIEMKDQFFYED